MKARAFTLLELLIVLIIISVLAAIALPALEGMIWRARFAEVFSTVGAITRAKQVYCAASDTYEGVPSYSYTDCLAGSGSAVQGSFGSAWRQFESPKRGGESL